MKTSTKVWIIIACMCFVRTVMFTVSHMIEYDSVEHVHHCDVFTNESLAADMGCVVGKHLQNNLHKVCFVSTIVVVGVLAAAIALLLFFQAIHTLNQLMDGEDLTSLFKSPEQ